MAILGPGDVIGEMIFLNRAIEVRYASAKAVEASELEVWHPGALSKEYEQVSPVLKYVTDQTLRRLLRMNNIVEQIGVKKLMKKGKPGRKQDPGNSRRAYYRKAVDLYCSYEPVNPSDGFHSFLEGYIKDLSMTGLSLEISAKNASLIPHEIGDLFKVKTLLPKKKRLEVTAKIVFGHETKGKIRLGMAFTQLEDLGSGARKALGFFLLPA